MFQKYKEIFFGLAFGLSAVVVDTATDAIADHNSFMDQVVEQPGMMLYRAVFVLMGLLLGWLLWQRNRRERNFREVTQRLHRIQQDMGTQLILLRSTLQTLLTRNDLHLNDEASRLLQDAYSKSQELQRIAEQDQPHFRG